MSSPASSISPKRPQTPVRYVAYGGPLPTFVRLHSLSGMIVFVAFIIQPILVLDFILAETPEPSRHIDLFSRLFGTLGFCLCLQTFMEPVLTKRSSLIHGLLAIAITIIQVFHREMLRPTPVLISFYFAICGIYFVIRAPKAVQRPASPEVVKRIQSTQKIA